MILFSRPFQPLEKTLLICDDGGDQNDEMALTYDRMLQWLVVKWHLHTQLHSWNMYL